MPDCESDGMGGTNISVQLTRSTLHDYQGLDCDSGSAFENGWNATDCTVYYRSGTSGAWSSTGLDDSGAYANGHTFFNTADGTWQFRQETTYIHNTEYTTDESMVVTETSPITVSLSNGSCSQ